MIELLLHILLTATAILGLHVATWDDMILNKPASWCNANLPYLLNKPLFNCPTCMASIWGTAYFITYNPAGWVYYPVFILAVSATATFLNRLLPTDEPD